MAQQFQFEVLSLERKDGVYTAKIALDGTEGDYEIDTNVYLSFIPSFPRDLRFHILSRDFYNSFRYEIDDKPRFMIRGVDGSANGENGEKIRMAFEEFIEQYSMDRE